LDVINNIPEDFCFLTLGHWLQGDLGEDRKNIGLTVKLFYEAFKNIKNQPALILKTSFGNSSKISKHEVFKKIHEIKKLFKKEDQLPNVYLLNSDLKNSEINKLYNHSKIKSLISLTKGEGFGRPLLEFSFIGKPIISTYWSGQVDFLKKDNILPLKGELKHVHPSSQNQWLIKEGKWFNVNEDETKNAFRIMFNNYKKYLSKADSQKKYVEENFTTDKMGEKLLNILNENYKPQPQFKPLVLPNIL
jgi:glycosyltransferase involved in cell wall biosynthesis